MNIHWLKDLKHPQQKNIIIYFTQLTFNKNLSIFINVIKIPQKSSSESFFSEEVKKNQKASSARRKWERKEEKNINKVKRHFW